MLIQYDRKRVIFGKQLWRQPSASNSLWATLNSQSFRTATYRIDGGAMFGIIPKVMWEKRIQPDERNTIPWALIRC